MPACRDFDIGIEISSNADGQKKNGISFLSSSHRRRSPRFMVQGHNFGDEVVVSSKFELRIEISKSADGKIELCPCKVGRIELGKL